MRFSDTTSEAARRIQVAGQRGVARRRSARSSMRSFLRVATSRSVVRRALTYAVVVGAVLIAINHADALAHGELGSARLLKMGLTLLVPYAVSTLSSVQALQEQLRSDR